MSAPQEPNGPLILVEAGNLAARVVIPASVDPQSIDADSVAGMARQRGVDLTGDIGRMLDRVVRQFVESGQPVNEVFARATPPVDGKDGFIEWRPGFDPRHPERDPRHKISDDARVDHYARQSFVRVRTTDHVATIRPPTPGERGRDVTGAPIEPRPGAQVSVVVEHSLRRFPDGRLVAERDGRLRYECGVIAIDPVLQVDGGVDFHTGHIDFEGDVHIRRDIRDRFRVRAAGSLHIEGIADACHLECRKDLTAMRGIAGRGVGTIDIGGNALVGYLDQLSGSIGRDLNVRKSIRRCELSIGGSLLSESGSIVAGRTTVGGSVRAAEIGAPSETPTEIVLALDAKSPPDRCIDVLRIIHPMVTLTIGESSITFMDPVKGPIRLWLAGAKGLVYRMGEGESRPIRTLRGVTARAAA